MNTYKICIVGPASSGKTTYVHKLLNNTFSHHEPTLGVEVHPIRVSYDGLEAKLNREIEGTRICFNFWDCSGTYPGLRDGYYIQAKGGIVMVESIESDIDKHNLHVYIDELRRIPGNENIKIVIVVSKSIENNNEWFGEWPIFKVNSETNMGIMEPITYLAGVLA